MPTASGQWHLSVPLQAVLILVLSLAVTAAAWQWVRGQGEALERIRFAQVADEAAAELHARMFAYEQILGAGVAFMEASVGVDRAEWRAFIERLDVEARFPGILGVGYAARVEGAELPAHEASVRAEGFTDYAVTPPGPREVSFPIIYLEPFAGRNLRAFGYDMFSEPVRHQAMVAARDSGRPALSGKVILVQETEQDVQPGALLYLPFYGRGVPPDVESRRTSLRGFVYSPFRMGDLARAVFGERLDRLCIHLYDGEVAEDALLFTNPGCVPGAHVKEVGIDMFGRTWVMTVRSTSVLDDSIASRRSPLILGAGTIISLLLMWAVAAMVAERRRRLALAQAYADLEQARARAAGSDAAKARFLAAASHDLRQPMQSLGIYLHLLVEESETGPDEIGQLALHAFDNATRLLDSMFDIAALESGRSEPALTRCDVGMLVDRVAAEFLPEAEMRGLLLKRRVQSIEVETDVVMLERIVRNLVANALKYTERGGVTITCKATSAKVRIRVADSGRGIPPDKRDLIFEDFYQLENPDRDPRKGLGLGLATAARLCRLLGYRLRVLSRVGRGSIFVVELPRPRAGTV